jgi:MFS family permease
MEAINTRTGFATATNVRWTNIAPTLLVIWIMGALDKSNTAIFISDPAFLHDFGLAGHAPLLGWLSTVVLLGYGLMAPLWGMAVVRFGPRKIVIASLSIWAITCFVCGMATNYNELLISRLALGVGEGALYPLTVALVANWFPLNERGRATGFWWIGTMIGPMVTGILITSLIVHFGWRWQFHVLGLVTLLGTLPMAWFLLRDKPEQHPDANDVEAELIDAGSLENNLDVVGRANKVTTNIWLSHRFWLIVIGLVGNNIFFWGWSSWLPTYLRTQRGMSFSVSGYLTFIIYGCAVFTILGMGYLGDKLSRRAHLAALGWGLGAVALISAAWSPDRAVCVILMMVALCCQQIGVSSCEALVHSVVNKADMSRTQGVRACIVQVMGALGPALIGYMVAATGGSFTVGFALLAVSIAMSSLCMAKLWMEGF